MLVQVQLRSDSFSLAVLICNDEPVSQPIFPLMWPLA